MPVALRCPQLPLTEHQVELLWQAVITQSEHADDEVAVQCVSPEQIQALNQRYRQVDAPTNVLTFSYPPDSHLPESSSTHDVSVCLEVAQTEAGEQAVPLPDYTALLLVHAFLHAVGFDHEQGVAQAHATHAAEQAILRTQGFLP
ncbi:MAG: rRNA maturation RNase YbeY, partial [Candidatus Andersenbacteria bacterium]